MIELLHGDCLELMKDIPDKSIDMILCDLPYGTTACKWDIVIPFEPLWQQYKRIIKYNGVIVLFGSQPFTSALIMSNPKMFRYEWIWQKAAGSNFATLKYQPMKEHENILVFSKNTHKYFPIKEERRGNEKGKTRNASRSVSIEGISAEVYGGIKTDRDTRNYGDTRNPSSIQFFNNRIPTDRGYHPTQKPVALLEYLIKTYTNKDEVVLDNCMGSGSTGVACINTKRSFIGIEKDDKYFAIAKNRIEQARQDAEHKLF
jgi:site-specific DNA-methyltransferase (adenine-specific)